MAEEKVEITYSYWDGSGHRRSIKVPKGTTVGRFLEWVRQDLTKDFPDLRHVSSENLMYVKEDLVIPHHLSFYDLIVSRAKGKTGPLFVFDVEEDVRLYADTRVQKEEVSRGGMGGEGEASRASVSIFVVSQSHPGKIVERRWYERNKHVFPASRWEVVRQDNARK